MTPLASNLLPCPACGEAQPGWGGCRVCGHLPPPPEGLEGFEALGIAPRFQLAPETLQRAFHDANRKFHPDRFAGRSKAEQQNSLAWSALVNTAWRTLRDPAERALRLLQRLDPSVVLSASNPVPRALAEEYFEMQEALEEATPERLAGWRRRLDDRRAQLEAQLVVLYRQADEALEAGRPGPWASLAERLRERGYLMGMQRDLEQRLGAAGALEDQP